MTNGKSLSIPQVSCARDQVIFKLLKEYKSVFRIDFRVLFEVYADERSKSQCYCERLGFHNSRDIVLKYPTVDTYFLC